MSPGMNNALAAVVASIDKKFGKNSVLRLTDTPLADPANVVPTGSIGLDAALGIGGYRKGRLVEIFGPESSGKTTLSLHAIANAQKAGIVCAFVDAEHGLDPNYARSLGVSLEDLLVSQPDFGEQALETVDMLAKSGEVGLIVVDSVAALVPQKELEGEVGDQHIGLQARMMSQAMRMITGTVHRTNCVVIFINQIRMKIGVMFGCFHYDARVLLADGTTEKIGKIVNQKLPVEVLSADASGKISAKKIVDWHDNGKANKFIQVVVEYPHGNGRANLPVGDDHTLITPAGEKKVSELAIGDTVFIRDTNYLTDEQVEYAVGTILGDASLRINDAENTASLRLMHGQKQNDYCIYKKSLFPADFIGNEGYSNGKFYWDSIRSPQLVEFAKYKEGGAIRFVDSDLLKKITLKSIALWYLDDGTFGGYFTRWGHGKSTIYATKMDKASKVLIADRFVELGLPRPSLVEKGFMFSGKDNKLFHEKIVQYVPSYMNYKIHPSLRSQCTMAYRQSTPGNKQDVLATARIVDIYKKSPDRSTHKFDITVEGNHSYFIDNVLVHNSPETTTGGGALKFYASQRLDIRRMSAIKQGEKIIGNRTKVKVVKNKLAPPFRETEFDIRFGIGIDQMSEIVDLGVEDQLIDKAGSWYQYNGTRIGQGKENVIQFLKEHEDVCNAIREQLIELRGLSGSPDASSADSKADLGEVSLGESDD
jgi:recombination protein RecA